jgi:hypothetical protein
MDLEAAKSEQHSSPDESRGDTEKKEPMQLLHEPVPRLRGTFKVSYASNWHRVTTPPEIIPYYRLNHSIWSLRDNKEASR